MKLMMDNERHEREFDEVRKLCPWRSDEKCRPTEFNFKMPGIQSWYILKDCTQKNCPIYYFKTFFERK